MQSFIRPVTHLSARLLFYHQQSRPGKQRIKVWLHEMISEYGDLPFTLSRRGQSGSCSMSHIYWAETQNKGRWWNSVCRTAVVDFKMWEKHRLFSALQLELICVAETDLSVPTEADLFHLNRQYRTQPVCSCLHSAHTNIQLHHRLFCQTYTGCRHNTTNGFCCFLRELQRTTGTISQKGQRDQ